MPTLIHRLETEAPSRELDAYIFCAVHHPDKKPSRNFFYSNREEWGVFQTNAPKPGITFIDAPHYTTSLDAAVSLVPEGFYYKLERYSDGCYAVVCPYSKQADVTLSRGAQRPAAIALTIECLKARRDLGRI